MLAAPANKVFAVIALSQRFGFWT